MAATPPSGTHLEHHNTLVTDLHAELTRFGLTPTSGGPFTAGDPYHIAEHGKMLTDLVTLASTAGQSYSPPLPAAPTLGDTGHIADHLAIRAAIDQAANWPAWNNASCGQDEYTVNNYNGTGEKWRVIEFLFSGTLTVNRAVQPFRVLVVGGGGASKYSTNSAQGGGGAGGILTDEALSLTPGAHTVTIGAGGTDLQNGENTTAFGLTAIGGGHGAFREAGGAQIGPGSGGSGGGESRNNPGAGGAGTAGQGFQGGSGNSANPGGGGAGGAGGAGGTGPGKASNITGSGVTYARGGGNDGWDASVQYGAGGNFAGLAAQPGVVIVAYRIG